MEALSIDPLVGNSSTWLMAQKTKKTTERVPQTIIDELLSKVSLLDLVKESTPIKSVSGLNTAHCPFHVRGVSDNSLSIDAKEQWFQCSECEFHGSAIGWLMFHDGLSFQDSIYELALRTDTDVSKWITKDNIEASRIKKRELLTEVSSYFADQLSESAGAFGYLKQRGIEQSTIDQFGIGFAPGKKDSLVESFPKKSRELWNQGLLVRLSDGEYGQRFRDRVMFPIRDDEGHTVGFGGRSLGDSQPKYLNSPSSPTFSKSNLLYGFYESMQGSSDGDRFILVEGYIDVLSLHQNGFDGAIATLGTSPSEHHIKKIYKKSDHLVACFDGDNAGLMAAERLLYAALPHIKDNQLLDFALLPPGQDPDSYIRCNGSDSFLGCLDTAISIDVFLYETLSRGIDLTGIGGKAQLANIARPVVDTIVSSQLRDSIINSIENIIGIPWYELDV